MKIEVTNNPNEIREVRVTARRAGLEVVVQFPYPHHFAGPEYEGDPESTAGFGSLLVIARSGFPPDRFNTDTSAHIRLTAETFEEGLALKGEFRIGPKLPKEDVMSFVDPASDWQEHMDPAGPTGERFLPKHNADDRLLGSWKLPERTAYR